MTLSLRAFAESRDYCNLDLSPLVAGIMDASAAIDTGLEPELLMRHFGCYGNELPSKRSRVVCIRAGARGGKTSRLIAPAALHAVWTVPLPTLARGEYASFIIVAPDLKLARQALTFVNGYVDGSEILTAACVEQNRDWTTLRRPDGNLVRIEILAATRSGRAVRGRTLVGAAMDEACFYYDESGVASDVDTYSALLTRIVPGGILWIVSSAWLEGVGLLEKIYGANFGTHVNALCVTAPTRALNPNWDPDHSIENAIRENEPDTAAREFDAIPLGGGSGTFLDAHAITQGIDHDRPLILAPVNHAEYFAGADWGFKRDSSALAIVCKRGDKCELALLLELRPSKGSPLRPDVVVDTFAPELKRYRCVEVLADAWYVDEIAPRLQTHGITLRTAVGATKEDTYVRFKTVLHEGRIRYPNMPRLLHQLRTVVSKPRAGGGLTISSPRSIGGGHGDLLSAAVLATWRASPARIAVSLASFDKYRHMLPRHRYSDEPRSDPWDEHNDVRTRNSH